MKLLIFHPVKVPVLHYGGTERILLWLAQSLVKMGLSVSVFAAPDSSMPAGIECLTDPAELKKRANEFDLIHGFSRLDAQIETDMEGRVLYTIHGNGQMGETFHINSVFLSRDHAKRHGAEAFVYNGIDPDELLFSNQVRPDRLLFLSKTSWRVKNLRGAADLVARAKQNLWIAGGESPYGLRMKTAMRSLVGQDWNWVGSVDQAEKALFLLKGRAVMFPILWNEPFGLVMVESLVSGTPVLANPYGSVPEILEFAPECQLKSEEEWFAALRGKTKLPDAGTCRDWAISRFDQRIMAAEYVKLYEKVMKGEKLNSVAPRTLIGAEDIGAHHA